MTNTPKVSVVVPNYNHEKYLAERLDSILNQTFKDFELIVLDDCSTDRSKEVIESYRTHPKVSHIVYNETNGGSVSAQWKKGIELAQGEWVWIAESDDAADESFLEVLMERASDEVGLIFSASYMIDEHSKIKNTRSWDKSLSDKMSGAKFVSTQMSHRNRIYNASMAIFRRSLFSGVPDDFLSKYYSGDWYFWIGIAIQCKKVVYVPQRLNRFRQHTNKVSAKGLVSADSFLESTDRFGYLAQYFDASWVYRKWYDGLVLHRLKRNQYIDNHKKEGLEQELLDSGTVRYKVKKTYLFWKCLRHLTPLKVKQ